MSIVDHESQNVVSYSPQDTYAALKKCLVHLEGYKIDRFDDNLLTAYVKAGVSLFSWGENITISISKMPDGASSVSVLSTPKTGIMLGGAMDMGKNRKNINEIMSALSRQLNNYPKIDLSKPNNSSPDVADQIKKLASLKDSGILTEEEFTAKKKQLLNI